MLPTPIKRLLLLGLAVTLSQCASKKWSTVEGSTYNPATDATDYFVVPFGKVSIPGIWYKTDFNEVSRQQLFKNADSTTLAIAFSRVNQYAFNTDGSKTGLDFVYAFYEWDSQYLVQTHQIQRAILEIDTANQYMIYRIFGRNERFVFDTYFLIGEQQGNVSNISIFLTDQWSATEKVALLKRIYLSR
jgi:hypothetical protein